MHTFLIGLFCLAVSAAGWFEGERGLSFIAACFGIAWCAHGIWWMSGVW
jgi:hypothetical protein